MNYTVDVLPNGTVIKIIKIDHDGLCGRDPHPTDKDIGEYGVIIGNEAWINAHRVENVKVCKLDLREEEYLLYNVQLIDSPSKFLLDPDEFEQCLIYPNQNWMKLGYGTGHGLLIADREPVKDSLLDMVIKPGDDFIKELQDKICSTESDGCEIYTCLDLNCPVHGKRNTEHYFGIDKGWKW